jgi:hypothetical protein
VARFPTDDDCAVVADCERALLGLAPDVVLVA